MRKVLHQSRATMISSDCWEKQKCQENRHSWICWFFSTIRACHSCATLAWHLTHVHLALCTHTCTCMHMYVPTCTYTTYLYIHDMHGVTPGSGNHDRFWFWQESVIHCWEKSKVKKRDCWVFSTTLALHDCGASCTCTCTCVHVRV
jgi:hypothetical protein